MPRILRTRASRTGSGKEKLGVIPNRVFALEFVGKGERILCFLEADRGSAAVKIWRPDEEK